MITILKPSHHKLGKDNPIVTSEPLRGGPEAPSAEPEKGIELDRDEESTGTGSAPGEGPNPTA